MSASTVQPEGTPHSWGERVAVAALAVVIVAGSAMVWIGVPVAGLWVAGRVTTDSLRFVMFSLIAIPSTMVALGWLLYRAGSQYERLRGTERRASSPPSWRSSLGEERARDRRQKGGRALIDVSMTASAVTALVVMAIWFFFYATSTLAPLP
jgi:hypothetical protein